MIKPVWHDRIPFQNKGLPRHRAEPDAPPGILINAKHNIARQAVLGIVGAEGVAVEAGGAVVGAEPHIAAAVLEGAVYLGAWQALLCGVVAEVGLGVALGGQGNGQAG